MLRKLSLMIAVLLSAVTLAGTARAQDGVTEKITLAFDSANFSLTLQQFQYNHSEASPGTGTIRQENGDVLNVSWYRDVETGLVLVTAENSEQAWDFSLEDCTNPIQSGTHTAWANNGQGTGGGPQAGIWAHSPH